MFYPPADLSTQLRLDAIGGHIAGWHCARAAERAERDMKAGTWKPAGLHAYSGQLRHLAGSAVTMWKGNHDSELELAV